MRKCGACGKPPREDDPMGTAQIEHVGIVCACRTCRGEADRVYSVGGPTPMVGEGLFARHAHICGICRRACFEGDVPKPIRILAEDLGEGETLQPGCFAACNECVAAIKPRIFERLQKAGVVKEISELHGNALL